LRNLSDIGHIFYGIAIIVMGILTVYYGKFPYMLIPPNHSWIPGPVIYIFGILLISAGVCIVSGKKVRPVSLLLGSVLLLIFCFYFIPYEFMSGTFKDFGEWENAEKELALAGGAFVIVRMDPFGTAKNENPVINFLAKLIPFGAIFFALPIICFGIDHFLDPQGVADYTPTWVPYKLFWAYFCGTALIGSGIAIILKIRVRIIATLLGTMILLWFILLHIPRVIASPTIYLGSEIASAFLALAYSGIAFVAGAHKKQWSN
jgi:uncharacterized membrane protein YphA (DoxX/SURF4 family)